jgi:TolB protein
MGVIILMLAIAALLMVLLQPVAWGQQGSVGTIVYEHAPNGGPPWPVTDIYSMSADGRNVKALTNDGHSHNPSWSPDGRRIVFIHDSALKHPVGLDVMDRDGRNRHLLRRIEPVIYSAAWSPDGKTLAVSCISEESANVPGLFLLPASGRGEPHLLFRGAFTPAWSPDGKKIAFSVENPRGMWALHVVDADGTHDVLLTDPILIAGSPAWSPDGKRIAFDEFADQARQQIFVMDANGYNVRQLTNSPNWSCGHPSWSPDGRQIAFSCRSAASPCGMVSSVGTILPECARRIFVVSLGGRKPEPRELGEQDGASPEFAPIQ